MIGRTKPADGVIPAGSDDGSALVETIVVIAVLLLPLVWVATALLRVEAASYAARQAAREAARTYVTSSSSAAGAARANAAARIAYADQGVPAGTTSTSLSCTANPCLTPGASVSASSRATVALPFVPKWLAGAANLQVTVSSSHEQKVEQYGGRR